MLVYLGLFALAQWLAGHAWSAGVGLVAVSSLMMAELNNSNSLIRIYSRMVSCSFIVLATMASFMLASPMTCVTQMAWIAFFICVFNAYQQPRAAGWVFYAFLALGVGSLVFVQMLWLVPLLWILLMTNVLCFSLRTFLASLLGLLIPYWFGAAWLAIQGDWQPAADHFAQLLVPGVPFDLTIVDSHQALTYLFVLMVTAIGSAHFLLFSYQDKIRTRMIYEMFISLAAVCLALALVLPRYFNGFLALSIVPASTLIGHFLALTHSRLSNWTFVAIVVMALSLVIYNFL